MEDETPEQRALRKKLEDYRQKKEEERKNTKKGTAKPFVVAPSKDVLHAPINTSTNERTRAASKPRFSAFGSTIPRKPAAPSAKAAVPKTKSVARVASSNSLGTAKATGAVGNGKPALQNLKATSPSTTVRRNAPPSKSVPPPPVSRKPTISKAAPPRKSTIPSATNSTAPTRPQKSSASVSKIVTRAASKNTQAPIVSGSVPAREPPLTKTGFNKGRVEGQLEGSTQPRHLAGANEIEDNTAALQHNEERNLGALVREATLACLHQTPPRKAAVSSIGIQTSPALMERLVEQFLRDHQEARGLVEPTSRSTTLIGSTEPKGPSYPALSEFEATHLHSTYFNTKGDVTEDTDPNTSLYPDIPDFEPMEFDTPKAVDREGKIRSALLDIKTDAEFYKEHIKSSPFHFFLSPIILRVVNVDQGYVVAEKNVDVPLVDCFTWLDAFIAYQNFGPSIGQALFQLVAISAFRSRKHDTDAKVVRRVQFASEGRPRFIRQPPYLRKEFWMNWMWFEWKHGFFENSLNILYFGCGMFDNEETKAELQAYWQRCAERHNEELQNGENREAEYSPPPPAMHILEPGQSPPLPSWTSEGGRNSQLDMTVTPSPPRSAYLEGRIRRPFADTPVFPETPLEKIGIRALNNDVTPTPRNLGSLLRSGRQRVGSTPYPRKSDVYGEIIGMLGAMQLNDDGQAHEDAMEDVVTSENKENEVKSAVGTPRAKKEGKKRVGVRFGPEVMEGSTVTLLTPVRAKKKDREALGVDAVLTPVRRSMRNYNEDDYVITKTPAEDDVKTELREWEKSTQMQDRRNTDSSTLTEDKIARLLQEHGYAFVPNKALNVQTPTAGRRMANAMSAKK
ncbi:uncharacterized protein SPPG_05476 [Spizellomyces punctatus DAOM BR117]|uniref:Uncharacterized protein n=1 Tax=Spizellomyces punctatus (strain DAOM BR117) TaxID=645134 RepID=A0A0L0HCF0_SPIPD|nr:uncharacterized protein SPPG_05476 [Spizellomyces punctatus DAOM BR117]KNC99220.1 hypothetical protein SPPG_05476 [Spizellomyces punctatus DAOM BR117]|eukprot:XP_016607260.1 hypothetical protein SPPG_05476 [Spizellomyces punctatus DAOM BR117]